MNTILDKTSQVGVKSGSPLAGIRKLAPNEVEDLETGKKRDREYAVIRTEAEAAIKRIAEGTSKNLDADKKLVGKWRAMTSFQGAEETVYDTLLTGNEETSADIATRLMSTKGRENLFKDYERINRIVNVDGLVVKGATEETTKTRRDNLLTTLSKAQTAHRDIQDQNEVASHVYTMRNMSKTKLDAYIEKNKGVAAVAQAAKHINDVRTSFEQLEKEGVIGRGKAAELAKMTLSEGEDAVQSLLRIIIGLLTTISNK